MGTISIPHLVLITRAPVVWDSLVWPQPVSNAGTRITKSKPVTLSNVALRIRNLKLPQGRSVTAQKNIRCVAAPNALVVVAHRVIHPKYVWQQWPFRASHHT